MPNDPKDTFADHAEGLKAPFKKGTLKPLSAAQLDARGTVTSADAKDVLQAAGPKLRALLLAKETE